MTQILVTHDMSFANGTSLALCDCLTVLDSAESVVVKSTMEQKRRTVVPDSEL